jgi:hypothetical protein
MTGPRHGPEAEEFGRFGLREGTAKSADYLGY